jgi:hypothetical protein
MFVRKYDGTDDESRNTKRQNKKPVTQKNIGDD